MLGEYRQRPLRADGKKTIIMRVDAHLEQARQDKQADAKPGNWFEPPLHGFDKDKLGLRIQRAPHGRKDEQRDRRETSHPRGRGKHVEPVSEGNCPGGWRRHYQGVGVSVGVSGEGAGVSVSLGVSVVPMMGVVNVGVTRAVKSMVGVGGKQTSKSSS